MAPMATALAVLAAGAIPIVADVDESITLSAADPLNLLGVLTPGPKTPAIRGGQVTYELSGASAATAS